MPRILARPSRRPAIARAYPGMTLVAPFLGPLKAVGSDGGDVLVLGSAGNSTGVYGPGSVKPTFSDGLIGKQIVYGNDASQAPIMIPGQGYTTIPASGVTIFAICTPTLNISATPRLVATTSDGNGLMLELGSGFGLLIGSVSHNFSGISYSVNRTYAVSVSWIPGTPNTFVFRVFDYASSLYSVASLTTSSSPISGDGTATIFNSSGGGSFNNCNLSTAGICSFVWDQQLFGRFAYLGPAAFLAPSRDGDYDAGLIGNYARSLLTLNSGN